jgi:hypothetical protein
MKRGGELDRPLSLIVYATYIRSLVTRFFGGWMSANAWALLMKMMRLSLLCGISIFATLNSNGQAPIDFRSGDNLKAVYDAGYRPWRDSPDSCNLDHVNISVVLPENARLSLKCKMAGFTALTGDQLSGANFLSEFMHTSEAAAKIREVCQSLGISTAGLEQAMAGSNLNSAGISAWGGQTQKGGIAIQVILNHFTYVNPIQWKIYVVLQWKHTGIPTKFLTGPIQPPRGYENASMEAPTVTPGNNSVLHHDFDYYKGLITKAQAQFNHNSPPTIRPSPGYFLAEAASDKRISIWAYGIIFLGFVLLVLAWVVLRSKR